MAEAKRYLRKRQNLKAMVGKIKLWPSRHGILHGVKSVVPDNVGFEITTHCGLVFKVRDSANSRAARWLRCKQYAVVCPSCRVPDWKVEKYGATVFSKRLGRTLPQDIAKPANGQDNSVK
jgi:pyrrolysyl-tRNA synthetase-like protein